MARQFNGSSDYGSAAINLSGVDRVSISLWLWVDAYEDAYHNAIEYTANAGPGNAWVFSPDTSTTGELEIADFSGTFSGICSTTIPRPSAAAWHHYLIVIDRTNAGGDIEAVYIDGSAQSLSYDNNTNTSGNFPNDTLYVMSRGAAASELLAGRLAEVALWPGVIINSTEAANLASGDNPVAVHPSGLAHYWPLYGDTAPEPSYGSNTTAMSITGATQVDHPTVDPIPRSSLWRSPSIPAALLAM